MKRKHINIIILVLTIAVFVLQYLNSVKMKELNVNQLENLEGGKFWGTSSSCHWEPSGDRCRTNYCDYVTQRFWIVTERLNHIPSGTVC